MCDGQMDIQSAGFAIVKMRCELALLSASKLAIVLSYYNVGFRSV